MPRVSEMIESKYLKQSDVNGETVVTIQAVAKKNVAREGDEPELKWLVKFEEIAKPMVLNSTNIKRIQRATGQDHTDNWKGKKVTLYVDHDVEFGGNIVGGLRIRGEAPGAGVAKPNEDDIPF